MKKLINLGVKPTYHPWEIFFVRKLNLIVFIGTFNVFLSFCIFPFFNLPEFQYDFLAMILIAPFIYWANHIGNYILAMYIFYLSGAWLMFQLSVKMGIDSYIILFYFPLILSQIHLLGRRETFKHLFILLSIYVVSIICIGLAYLYRYNEIQFAPEVYERMRIFILVLSMTTSIGFFGIVTHESINQEELIKKMLKEKEVLLAEVYHRVKNNMSIVTSLLNLKKNTADSNEVKEALESCRSRVYSMSLVHEKFFSQNSLTGIDFTHYAKDLIEAVTNSFGGNRDVEVHIEADDIYLDVSQAIPCGLILNETLTNSFKHAIPTNGKLILKITLINHGEAAEIIISDNGQGFDPKKISDKGSMGIELMHSLCEQLDAICQYTSENGSTVSIKFDIIKT
ncbi:MAG: sensor histidine kinase, partial [Crocinitomicaceae bacterium]|nr:sensor histidine kinase [Crocinitomicaceae bacterium]